MRLRAAACDAPVALDLESMLPVIERGHRDLGLGRVAVLHEQVVLERNRDPLRAAPKLDLVERIGRVGNALAS